MPRSNRPDAAELLHTGLLGMHQLRRCLYGLGGVPCFILHQVLSTGRIEWWELLRDDRRLRPFDFEFRLGRPEVRDAYHRHNLARVRRSGRAYAPELYGFRDLYVPLAVTSSATLVLYAGQWAKAVPSYADLCRTWHELSGREAAAADPLFRRWLRTCLEVPVLSPEQVHGLKGLGRAVARLAAGAPPSEVQKRIEGLRRRVFAPHAVDHNWIASAVDLDGLTRPPWGLDSELDPRLVDELGLTRRPSAIGLLSLDRRQLRPAPLEEQVVQRRLQHEATRLCRQLESCLAGPLEDGSVIVALSVAPQVRGKNRGRRLESLLRELQRSLAREVGLPTVAGLGLEVSPGDGLGASYRQAATALASALATRKSFQRYDHELAGHLPTRHTLKTLADSLVDKLERRATSELRLEAARFARTVLAAEGENPSGVRAWLSWSLHAAVARLEREGVLSATQAREHLDRADAELGSIAAPTALAEAFELRLAALPELLAHPYRADREARLRGALEWLERHLDTPSPLEAVARRSGLAPSSFRRAFRAARGQSFGAWLRSTRVRAAQSLLANEDLPVTSVARQVGFGEVHTFIRAFREQIGKTPGAYRRDLLDSVEVEILRDSVQVEAEPTPAR